MSERVVSRVTERGAIVWAVLHLLSSLFTLGLAMIAFANGRILVGIAEMIVGLVLGLLGYAWWRGRNVVVVADGDGIAYEGRDAYHVPWRDVVSVREVRALTPGGYQTSLLVNVRKGTGNVAAANAAFISRVTHFWVRRGRDDLVMSVDARFVRDILRLAEEHGVVGEAPVP